MIKLFLILEPHENKKALDQFCINLNQKSKDGKIDKLIGRKSEIDRTISNIIPLKVKNKNNKSLGNKSAEIIDLSKLFRK